jgi:hypothetical protein
MVLGSCVPATPDSSTSAPPERPGRVSETCRSGEAEVGVFRDSSQPDLVRGYESWLGCRVSYVVDFPARNTWTTIAHPQYLLDAWRGTDWTMVLSLALLPTEQAATLEQGATGAYDEYFVSFAEALVDGGYADTVVRPGWEFNLPGSRWFTRDPDLFVAYFRRVVQALRSVEGQRFTIVWNPGASGVDAVPYYPGNEYVDLVGVDIYDATGAAGTYPYPSGCEGTCRSDRQRSAWQGHLFGGDTGLRHYRDFARAQQRPLALPEWGLWERPDGTGGGENPQFLRWMHAFVADPGNDVAFHAYFEHDGSDGRHRLMTSFPQAGAVYRDLVTPESPATTARPDGTQTPAALAPAPAGRRRHRRRAGPCAARPTSPRWRWSRTGCRAGGPRRRRS